MLGAHDKNLQCIQPCSRNLFKSSGLFLKSCFLYFYSYRLWAFHKSCLHTQQVYSYLFQNVINCCFSFSSVIRSPIILVSSLLSGPATPLTHISRFFLFSTCTYGSFSTLVGTVPRSTDLLSSVSLYSDCCCQHFCSKLIAIKELHQFRTAYPDIAWI